MLYKIGDTIDDTRGGGNLELLLGKRSFSDFNSQGFALSSDDECQRESKKQKHTENTKIHQLIDRAKNSITSITNTIIDYYSFYYLTREQKKQIIISAARRKNAGEIKKLLDSLVFCGFPREENDGRYKHFMSGLSQTLKSLLLFEKKSIDTYTYLSQQQEAFELASHAYIHSEDTPEIRQLCLAFLYRFGWSEYQFLIPWKKNLPQKPPYGKLHKPEYNIVYNNDGYDETAEHKISRSTQKGYPILLDKNTPIGYVAYMPNQQITGVWVHVYGGDYKTEREEFLIRPQTRLSKESLMLINSGICLVYLNLIDLLELEVSQLQIPLDIHNRIQKSIHKFYEIISKSPGNLSPTLEKLKGKKICLYGASFGGTIALRHSQLFPRTFAGYISFNGYIHGEVGKASTPNVFEPEDLKEYADPALYIDEHRDPVLIIQNLNDNRVNAQIPIEYLNQVYDKGLGHLFKLRINRYGRSSYSENMYGDLRNIDASGHSYPNFYTHESLNTVHDIIHFIQKGLPCIAGMTHYRLRKYGLESKKNYLQASPTDLHIAEMISITSPDERISSMIFLLKHILVKQPRLLQNFICDLDAKGLIENEHIMRSILHQRESFLYYLQAKGCGDEIDLSDLESPLFVNEYKASLFEKDMFMFNRALLNAFFMSNPDLLDLLCRSKLRNIVKRNDYVRAQERLTSNINELRKSKLNVLYQFASQLVFKERNMMKQYIDGNTKRAYNATVEWISLFSHHGTNKGLVSRIESLARRLPFDTRCEMYRCLFNYYSRLDDSNSEKNRQNYILNRSILSDLERGFISENRKINSNLNPATK